MNENGSVFIGLSPGLFTSYESVCEMPMGQSVRGVGIGDYGGLDSDSEPQTFAVMVLCARTKPYNLCSFHFTSQCKHYC